MYRFSFVAALLLVSCGPAAEEPDAGFPLFPQPPATSNGSIPQGYADRCLDNSECRGGAACVQEMCLSYCSTDAQCASGTRCLGNGVRLCVVTCETDASCPAGLSCYVSAPGLGACVRLPTPMDAGVTGGGTGGGGGGSAGAGGGGGAAPNVNLAEKVWVAQENVFRLSVQLRSSYGEGALSWLRLAKRTTGTQVTTGSLTEHVDGTATFVSGGTTLRVTTKTGRQFQLRVDALVGDVSAATFPWNDDQIDVTWIFATGATSRCVFAKNSEHFVGTFVTDLNEEVTADVSRWVNSTVYSGDTGSGYATDISGEGRFSGYVQFPDRRVDFTTPLVYSTCSGACGFSPAQDYVYTHDVTLTFTGGGVWTLHYNTGWKKQYSYSLTEYYWGGSIRGAASGSMVKRPIASSAVALDVVIGADRYTATGVTVP